MIPQRSQLQQSLHRGGCCCDCAAQIEVTLAGFDGNHCAACVAVGSGSKIHTASSGFDGTFTLDLLDSNATRCRYYSGFFVDLGTSITATVHSDTTCTAPGAAETLDLVEIVVDVFFPNLGVRAAHIRVFRTGGTSDSASDVFAMNLETTPGLPLETAISNDQVCDPPNNPGIFSNSTWNSHSAGTISVKLI